MHLIHRLKNTVSVGSPIHLAYIFKLIYCNWRIIYNIVMVFAIHQHEWAIGIHVS